MQLSTDKSEVQPDSMPKWEGWEEEEPPLRLQELNNFGHAQWGFRNWSWAVTKQELDFVELYSGKYTAGVVAFVSITVKSLDIYRENIGYATSLAPFKGAAIHNARKCAVTNALRETLLSFGGSVTTELMELLDPNRNDQPVTNQNQNQTQNRIVQNTLPQDSSHENNQNVANIITKKKEKNLIKVKDEAPGKVTLNPMNNVANTPVTTAQPIPSNLAANIPANRLPPTLNIHPNMNANAAPRHGPPLAPQPAPILRPNSNEVRLEDLGEEEARAERKRRQRQAQEEFRLKQLMKQNDLG